MSQITATKEKKKQYNGEKSFNKGCLNNWTSTYEEMNLDTDSTHPSQNLTQNESQT